MIAAAVQRFENYSNHSNAVKYTNPSSSALPSASSRPPLLPSPSGRAPLLPSPALPVPLHRKPPVKEESWRRPDTWRRPDDVSTPPSGHSAYSTNGPTSTNHNAAIQSTGQMEPSDPYGVYHRPPSQWSPPNEQRAVLTSPPLHARPAGGYPLSSHASDPRPPPQRMFFVPPRQAAPSMGQRHPYNHQVRHVICVTSSMFRTADLVAAA